MWVFQPGKVHLLHITGAGAASAPWDGSWWPRRPPAPTEHWDIPCGQELCGPRPQPEWQQPQLAHSEPGQKGRNKSQDSVKRKLGYVRVHSKLLSLSASFSSKRSQLSNLLPKTLKPNAPSLPSSLGSLSAGPRTLLPLYFALLQGEPSSGPGAHSEDHRTCVGSSSEKGWAHSLPPWKWGRGPRHWVGCTWSGKAGEGC